ncbi:MAG TPA: gas vesicle protein GvpJ [Methylomirabilota bacterium]|nr:gas vesicle protein GvpJ [Methylomirabilota bacterium]
MKAPARERTREILEAADDSLLDLVDNLLNRGVVISGEVMLGLAGVDLVYLRLTALLCAADRVKGHTRP